MFKVGDRVRLKTEQVQFGMKFVMDDEGEVLDISSCTSLGPALVEILMYPSLKIIYVLPANIEHCTSNNTLPTGTQPSFAAICEAIDNSDIGFRAAFIVPNKCDCGGLKIHGSLEPMFHSHWCSSQSGAK